MCPMWAALCKTEVWNWNVFFKYLDLCSEEVATNFSVCSLASNPKWLPCWWLPVSVLRAPARRRARADGEEVGGFPRDRSARIDSSRPAAAVAVSAVAELAAVWMVHRRKTELNWDASVIKKQ